MPLILAIEPDRRQASQLNAVVKGRLRADLVLADSAERALKELGDRVPDLILTSALLSPTDEVVLGDRLRKLNGVVAHVQTLTIPVLAGPKPSARSRAGGMLSALRRGKAQDDATPDGCDPSVFAAQCAEYLERAVAEQAANRAAAREERTLIEISPAPAETPAIAAKETATQRQAIDEFEAIDEPIETTTPAPSSEPAGLTRSTNPFMADPVPPPPIAARPIPLEPVTARPVVTETFAEQQFIAEPASFAAAPVATEALTAASSSHEHLPAEPIAEPVFNTEQPVKPEPARQPLDTPSESFAPRRREPATPVFIDATAAAASVSEAIAQIEAFVTRESLASETIANLEANEFAETNWETASSGWEPAARSADEDDTGEGQVPEGFIELDLSTLLEDPQVDEPKRNDDEQRSRSTQFQTDDEPFVIDIDEFNEFLVAASKPAVKTQALFTAPPANEPAGDPVITPDPIEKIEIEKTVVDTPSRLGVSQLWPAMDGVVAEAPSLNTYKDGLAAVAARTAPTRASSPHKPVQDEWGFFDPDQCGFAALLAKLDEIIDTDDRSA